MSTSPDENPTGSAGHCVAPVQPHVQAIRIPEPTRRRHPSGRRAADTGRSRAYPVGVHVEHAAHHTPPHGNPFIRACIRAKRPVAHT